MTDDKWSHIYLRVWLEIKVIVKQTSTAAVDPQHLSCRLKFS